jgi:hypothetical protein
MTKAKRLLLHLLLGLSTGNAQGPDQQGKATQQHFSFTILLYVVMTVQDTRYMYLDHYQDCEGHCAEQSSIIPRTIGLKDIVSPLNCGARRGSFDPLE